MSIAVVVGNPKPRSRTWAAAHRLAQGLGEERVAQAVESIRSSDIVIVASPTFKATYSGLLKLFLDQFDTGDGLAGVVAVPLMLGAAPALYLLDSADAGGPVEEAWLGRWRATIRAAVGVSA